MYCRSGNETAGAEIGNIDPIITGDPLSGGPDGAGATEELPPDGLDELDELDEHAATPSARQARPAVQRSRFRCILFSLGLASGRPLEERLGVIEHTQSD